MATGNLRVATRPCRSCGRATKAEKNGMIWGGGDLILVLLTWGAWVLIRFALNAMTNPWRCSVCGSRV